MPKGVGYKESKKDISGDVDRTKKVAEASRNKDSGMRKK